MSPVRPASLLATGTEAARILLLSLHGIENLRSAGMLLARKHGSRVLLPLAELERYAESLPWEVDLRA
ncbi:hypothetical protein CH294_02240 [Rhodococcus sp. 14-2483-1-1]|nr:hypothetical protein CH294_02240 [Rhodococcus sp. 14-2483-1-1]